MNEPMISIAAICYNNAAYIETWTRSILAQQCPWPIEVVITDDCSTDGSWDLLQSTKQQLEEAGIECRLFRNEKNSGCGPTRHNSLMNCRGKYLLFLDGDDRFVGRKSFSLLVGFAEKYKSDCVIFGTLGYSALWACGTVAAEPVLYEPRAACASVLNRSDSVVVWNKLWRREAIQNIEYLCLRTNEDTVMTPLWLWSCKNVVQVPVIAYYYTDNAESLTHTYGARKDAQKHKEHLECVKAAEIYMLDFFAKNDREMILLAQRRLKTKTEDDGAGAGISND